MTSRAFVVLALILLTCSPTSWGKKKHPWQPPRVATIIAVSLTDMTVQAGNDGQGVYKFDANTKVTVDGLPSKPDALRAGMLVKFRVSPDGDTALSVNAQDRTGTGYKP